MKKIIIISKDKSGDFTTIGEALNSISGTNDKRIFIHIKKGIYREKLFIDKPFITLIGESAEDTVITFNDYAKKEFPDGKKYGTFNSYTIFIGSDNFSAENITIENSAGAGSVVGQAIAAYVDADRISFRNCKFLGSQDTLFIGPLPPSPIIPGGFFGPREFAERRVGRQYYENCFIKGDIDFIFGSGIAVFNNCAIYSINRNEAVNGYITAASTPENEEFGFTFINCRIIGDAGNESVYLGRPWRDHAKTVFINCFMGEHIKKEGWHDWDKKVAQKSVYFGEYNTLGQCMQERVQWAKKMTLAEIKKYTIENILCGKDRWDPLH